MRLDLVVNTMLKTALQDGRIIVNNPSIWRPILAIQDAAAAYVRAVEAAPSVSGTFNVASENTTLGALADQVAASLAQEPQPGAELDIREKADVRNYKVSVDRARVQLGFKPSYDIEKIVRRPHREPECVRRPGQPCVLQHHDVPGHDGRRDGSEPPQRPFLRRQHRSMASYARPRPGRHRPAGCRRRRCFWVWPAGTWWGLATPTLDVADGPAVLAAVCSGTPITRREHGSLPTISTGARRIKRRPTPSMQ